MANSPYSNMPSWIYGGAGTPSQETVPPINRSPYGQTPASMFGESGGYNANVAEFGQGETSQASYNIPNIGRSFKEGLQGAGRGLAYIGEAGMSNFINGVQGGARGLGYQAEGLRNLPGERVYDSTNELSNTGLLI